MSRPYTTLTAKEESDPTPKGEPLADLLDPTTWRQDPAIPPMPTTTVDDPDWSQEAIDQALSMLNKREIAELDAELAGTHIPLRDYAKQAFELLEPGREYLHNWHIDAICEYLTAATRLELTRLIINIPPRHMKSLLVSVCWPTWVWSFLPQTRWMCQSYAEQLAIRDAVKSRALMQSDWYQRQWGHVWSFSGDQNLKSYYENNHYGFRLSAGVAGMATGEGGDFIIVDDPHKVREVNSDVALKNVAHWWDDTMTTRDNTPGETVRVVIMQRIHQRDLSGHILEKMAEGGPKYEILCLPAEYEDVSRYFDGLDLPDLVPNERYKDPRTEHGELIWSKRFNKEYVNGLKVSMGTFTAAGQLQQRPAPSTGGIFKKYWWRFWQYPGQHLLPVQVYDEDGELVTSDLLTLEHNFDKVAESWDMTFKETTSGSFVCGQVWGKIKADMFLLDQVRGRWELVETIRQVTMLSERWQEASAKYIEDKANGPAVQSTLRKKIPGIIMYSPQGSKEARAQAASPRCESGNVYLPHPHNAPWVWGLIERFANFPADFEDEIDTFSQIADIWDTGKRSGTWGTGKAIK